MPGPIGLRSPIASGVRQSGRVAAAAVCAIAFASVQCGQVADRRAVEGSSITLLYPIDERGLGPMGGEASQFLVFLPLVIRNHDGQLEGRLARRWEHSDDYRTWTVHLRTGVRWHDGVAVTAHDIKFTLDLFKHPEVHWGLPDAYTVTILNDSTYTINYKRAPGRPLDYHGTPLAYWTVYYPKHLLENLDPKEFRNWEFWKHPVGNGPYRYVRTVPKTLIEVEANPDYYRGVPKIERVILKFGLPSLTELLSGNVDALVNANRVDILKLTADPRFRIYHYALGVQETAVYWNQRRPLFRDPKVRRALTLAINRQELHKLVNLPEGTPIFDVIFTERQYERGELPPPLRYDPGLAGQLLDEAGWRDIDRDGVRERDGVPFRFTTLIMTASWSGGTMRGQAAVYIQEQLRRVGIQMEIVTMDVLAGRERWRAGDFDAAITTAFGGELAHRSRFGKEGPSGYMNPRVIELLETAAATMNPQEIDRIYREIWPIFQADLPITGLYPTLWTTVAHRRVRGLSSPYRADPAWYMDELWLEEPHE